MRRRWFSRRALGLHLLLAIWAPGCVIAGWWQADVAMSGNTLSYLYAVEWPVFALFGLIVWWNLIHDDPALTGVRGTHLLRRKANLPEAPSIERRADEEDPELRAYNAYLTSLAEQGPSTWRRR